MAEIQTQADADAVTTMAEQSIFQSLLESVQPNQRVYIRGYLPSSSEPAATTTLLPNLELVGSICAINYLPPSLLILRTVHLDIYSLQPPRDYVFSNHGGVFAVSVNMIALDEPARYFPVRLLSLALLDPNTGRLLFHYQSSSSNIMSRSIYLGQCGHASVVLPPSPLIDTQPKRKRRCRKQVRFAPGTKTEEVDKENCSASSNVNIQHHNTEKPLNKQNPLGDFASLALALNWV